MPIKKCLSSLGVHFLTLIHFSTPFSSCFTKKYFLKNYSATVDLFYNNILCLALESCKFMFLWTRTQSGPDPFLFVPISGIVCIHKLRKDQDSGYLLATFRK